MAGVGLLQITNAMEYIKYYLQAYSPHEYGMISANNPIYL